MCGWRSGLGRSISRETYLGMHPAWSWQAPLIGLLAALWVSGLLDALLFEVSTFDPIVAIASAALLTAAALAASYVPARRAARVNPIAALKTD